MFMLVGDVKFCASFIVLMLPLFNDVACCRDHYDSFNVVIRCSY